MKKLILLSLVSLLCLPLAVYAASIGGVETQGAEKFSIGLDQEFVFDRDMKYKSGTQNMEWKKVEIERLYRTMVKASYGLVDNLDLYLKLGTADAKVKGKIVEAALDHVYTANTDNAFAYGFGLKGAYSLENNWILGADLQYLRHKHDARCTYTGSTDWDVDYTFQEWQVAPYVAKKIDNLVPYFGVKYSDLRMEHKDNGGSVKFKADDNFGVFLGTGYKVSDVLSLNLEARFIDETAISLGGTYKF